MAVRVGASIPAWFGFVSVPGKPYTVAWPEPVRLIVLQEGDALAPQAAARQAGVRGEEGAERHQGHRRVRDGC